MTNCERLDIVVRLLALPAELAAAEETVVLKARTVYLAREELQQAEDAALLAGECDGKNERERLAQLRQRTARQRDVLALSEDGLLRARAALAALQAESSCLRAVAKMVGGGE